MERHQSVCVREREIDSESERERKRERLEEGESNLSAIF